jgi:hypothetical protein
MAQQQLDSKLDLGRVVDIRKKVFSQVKVCWYIQVLPFPMMTRII